MEGNGGLKHEWGGPGGVVSSGGGVTAGSTHRGVEPWGVVLSRGVATAGSAHPQCN